MIIHSKINYYTTWTIYFSFSNSYYIILQIFVCIEYVKVTLKEAAEGRSILTEKEVALLRQLLAKAEDINDSIISKLKKSSSSFRYYLPMVENPIPVPSRLIEMNYQYIYNELDPNQLRSMDHFMMDMMGTKQNPKCTFTGK